MSPASASGRGLPVFGQQVHVAIDTALGLPVRVTPTGGERKDIARIEPPRDGSDASFVLADKGYVDGS
jgi:hypothetical protein